MKETKQKQETKKIMFGYVVCWEGDTTVYYYPGGSISHLTHLDTRRCGGTGRHYCSRRSYPPRLFNENEKHKIRNKKGNIIILIRLLNVVAN